MQSRMPLIILGIMAMIFAVNIIALVIYFTTMSTCTGGSDDVLSPPPPSNSVMGIYSEAAIVTSGASCASIGRQMLTAGGNAVDAAIATLLCDGVMVMQSLGVGGGCLMTIYNKTERKAYSLIARETAPVAATKDMYVDGTLSSTLGPISAGIPGELKGYQEAHRRFGKLPWKDLLQPTIKLCEEGFKVSMRLADDFFTHKKNILNSPSFVKVILNSTGGRIPKEGDIMKLPHLARTLRIIAESPKMADELYNGSLTEGFVQDLQSEGGIITVQDMNDYQVRWEEPFVAQLSGGLTAYSAALPGSGILVAFMLRLLDGLIQYADSEVERSQMIVETFKHAYGRRTDLGDPHFMNKTLLDQVVKNLTDEDEILRVREKIKLNWTSPDVKYYGADYVGEEHGTHNMAAVAGDLAVCATSTVNIWFGGYYVSPSTGILLNNEMDDFATSLKPNFFGVSPSEANFIAPRKMPQSSMAPTVVVDENGDVRLVVGAAGGSKITTEITLVAIRNLWFGENIKEAIDSPRFHHQLLPMNLLYEYGTPKYMVDSWKAIGHNVSRAASSKLMAVVTGIAKLGNKLTACWDWRKTGVHDGF